MKGVGRYDLETALAMRFHWTPEQIYALDPDYLDELVSRLEAQDAHDNKPKK